MPVSSSIKKLLAFPDGNVEKIRTHNAALQKASTLISARKRRPGGAFELSDSQMQEICRRIQLNVSELFRKDLSYFPNLELSQQRLLKKSLESTLLREEFLTNAPLEQVIGYSRKSFVVKSAVYAIKFLPNLPKNSSIALRHNVYLDDSYDMRKEWGISNFLAVHPNVQKHHHFDSYTDMSFIVTDLAFCDLEILRYNLRSLNFVPNLRWPIPQDSTRLNPTITRDLFKNVAAGIAHMHQKGVAHGDIKLDNILVYYTPAAPSHGLLAKITDFDSYSRTYSEKPPMSACYGSALMSPPELWVNYVTEKAILEADVFACDMWALGLILCLLLLPLDCLKNTVYDIEWRRSYLYSKISFELHGILINVDHLCDHAAVTKALIKSLLRKEPALRSNSLELLQLLEEW